MGSPGNSLSYRESACFENCAKRFLETTQVPIRSAPHRLPVPTELPPCAVILPVVIACAAADAPVRPRCCSSSSRGFRKRPSTAVAVAFDRSIGQAAAEGDTGEALRCCNALQLPHSCAGSSILCLH